MEPAMDEDMNELAIRARQGDKEAFIALVRQLETQMYGIAKAIVKKDEDCADAMQETALKAYEALPSLKSPAYFKTWLLRILINECNAMLRIRSRHVVMADVPEQRQPQRQQTAHDLEEAIYRLEEVSRTIVVLHYYRDIPLREIAGMLDMSEGAVKTRLHRARVALLGMLSESGEGKMTYGTS